MPKLVTWMNKPAAGKESNLQPTARTPLSMHRSENSRYARPVVTFAAIAEGEYHQMLH